MFNLLANSLVVVGICLLASSLIPVGQLIKQIPTGLLRRKWYTMVMLIVIFVAGYISYLYFFGRSHQNLPSLIVPVIFFFGAGFVWLAATLSLQTAADIRRVVLLEQENITDPLLDIYNRRYLDRRLAEEVSCAKRSGMPLSVLLLDFDYFKNINDAYGHQVGDQVLKYLSKLVLQVIRKSDIAARYGGEELLVIAPDTTATIAATLAERIRHHIETNALVLSSEPSQRQEIRMTVSIGVASLDPDIADYKQLVANADEALYRAKQEGRNRVVTNTIGFPRAANPCCLNSTQSSNHSNHHIQQ